MSYSQEVADHWELMDEDQQKGTLLEVARAYDGATNFNSLLIRLVQKADVNNLSKLFSVYPHLVAATHTVMNGIIDFEGWQKIQDEAREKEL